MWFGQLDQYGSIDEGKVADLMLLERNPLEDIEATRAIHTVLLRGEVQDRTALDRLLANTRTKVAVWDAKAAERK
ncbi:hypothetical protein [Microbulbifer sp. YPW1]|uniref:hypothetical protein n=1 Tax=Microbulbifer sp. YPW1 TaxID=2745199 RepID=UPI001C625E5E|nr:hypothetical protein [Microbulbifer sp. YPW1]